jgi:hypothetical protein
MDRLVLQNRREDLVHRYKAKIADLAKMPGTASEIAAYQAVVTVTRREAEWPIA